jgi:tRNA A-37 threonylcarbamoyl transferase component Bud32
MSLTERRTAHGRYQPLRALGEGGFGRVFEARDVRTQQHVAIKELVQSSPSALARFKHEFRALQDIHHVNLVGLKELYELDGRWYIVMELITGTDLLGWVCPRPAESDNQNQPHTFDEARLRKALLDIVLGLRTLHQHGVLHRDLKPSNIRIGADEHAVLLDFGLVTSLDRNTQTTAAMGIGTAAYTAPEQAAGDKVDRAADYYALGACLYEALTGGVPFEGESQLQMLVLKQQRLPEPPCSLVPNVPADLDALCMRLLARTPNTRIGADEVLAVLSKQDAAALESTFPIPVLAAGGFAGRERELERCEHAFETTLRGELSVLLIEGECGVGKSALVTEFLRRQRQQELNLLILKGRCYENEQVSYKAFDGCIDALAKTLKRLPRRECEALLPACPTLLSQMFPVLLEVPALAEAKGQALSSDPTARRETFLALQTLLANLAKQAPIIIVIDDLQWADAESFRMLRTLLDDGEPPHVLFLCTLRPRMELSDEVREQTDFLRALPYAETLSLHGLSVPETRKLALHLVGSAVSERCISDIVAESRGHPLFLSVLAQHATTHDVAAGTTLTLETALGARLTALPQNARRLLELIALSAKPHESSVFVRALGIAQGFDTLLKPLLAERLIRVGQLEEIDCFHDRVRQIITKLMSPPQRAALHKKLAQALAADSEIDASEPARHWDAAGLPERALAAYETAGVQALENLAFARAEQFFARALSLLGDARDGRTQRNWILHGHALSRAGNNPEAAKSYAVAAGLARGEERLRLQVSVAQHLLQGGFVEEGVEQTGHLFEELKLPLPSRPGSALANMLWDRGFLMLRGTKARLRNTRHILGSEQLELDAIWHLSLPLAWVDFRSGTALSMRYLRRALSVGHPTHVARALAQRAALLVLQAPAQADEAKRMMASSKELSAQLADPSLDAYLGFMEGCAALLGADFLTARRCLESAEVFLQTRCQGEPWLATNVRVALASTWFQQGDFAKIQERTPRWLEEARERGDRFAFLALLGIGAGFLGPLMEDDPERALTDLHGAVQALPQELPSLVQLAELSGLSVCHLYRGSTQLNEWFSQHETVHARSLLLRTRLGWERTSSYRSLAALLAAVNGSDAEQRKVQLHRARKAVMKLARIKSGMAPALADLTFAQICLLDAQPEKALLHAQRARVSFAQSGVHYVHSAAFLEGTLRGGDEGAALRNHAIDHYRTHGFRNPERGLITWLPALRGLTFARAETCKPP